MSEERSEERYDTAHFMDNLCRVMRNYDLSWGEMGVLGCLIRHDCPDPRNGGNRKGEVWPSPSNGLQEMTGKDRKVLRLILKSLEQKGLITCLTPERSQGGRGQVHHWQINYQALGWKFSERKLVQITPVSSQKLVQITPGIWESESESRNLPPPSPPPSSQPLSSPLAPSHLEEEEFSFLSPDERTCLQRLQVSPSLWRRVRQSEPGLVQAALQHLLSRKEDILSTGHSLEERFGGLLTGRFVPSPEREIPAQEEEAPVCWYLCQTCGITYTGEHLCALTGKEEPQGAEEQRNRGAEEQGSTRIADPSSLISHPSSLIPRRVEEVDPEEAAEVREQAERSLAEAERSEREAGRTLAAPAFTVEVETPDHPGTVASVYGGKKQIVRRYDRLPEVPPEEAMNVFDPERTLRVEEPVEETPEEEDLLAGLPEREETTSPPEGLDRSSATEADLPSAGEAKPEEDLPAVTSESEVTPSRGGSGKERNHEEFWQQVLIRLEQEEQGLPLLNLVSLRWEGEKAVLLAPRIAVAWALQSQAERIQAHLRYLTGQEVAVQVRAGP